MAGYRIYSLDSDGFQTFVNNPTDKQLRAVAKFLSRGQGEDDDELNEELPPSVWPSEPEKLCPMIKERLARPDWYGDLSDADKSAWASAIQYFCSDQGAKAVGFRVDNDGIYWDALQLVRQHLNLDVQGEQIVPDIAVSGFGTRPYRYHPPADAPEPKRAEPGDDEYDDDDYGGYEEPWTSHSMHAPDEVNKMLEELRSIEPAMENDRNNARNKNAVRDYHALVEVLEQLVDEGRMLFIEVDT